MARADLHQVAEALRGARRIAVCAHVHPDGDALGSVLGFAAALRAAGREVETLLADTARPRDYAFLPGYDGLTEAADYDAAPDAFVAIDVPNPERAGGAAPLFDRASMTVIVDHHPDTALDAADLAVSSPDTAAAAMLVWELIGLMGLERTPEVAVCCYTGLMTDTGRFQYQNTDSAALEAAAQMVAAGADPAIIAQAVYQNRTLASLKLDSLVASRIELFDEGRGATSWFDAADLAATGATNDDADQAVDLLRSLGGPEVYLLLRGQEPGVVRGNLRAKCDRDVGRVARMLGGGGHAGAAGFTAMGTVDEVRARVVPLLFSTDGE